MASEQRSVEKRRIRGWAAPDRPLSFLGNSNRDEPVLFAVVANTKMEKEKKCFIPYIS